MRATACAAALSWRPCSSAGLDQISFHLLTVIAAAYHLSGVVELLPMHPLGGPLLALALPDQFADLHNPTNSLHRMNTWQGHGHLLEKRKS